MNAHPEPTPQMTLEHFLKLAWAQLRSRLSRAPAGASAANRGIRRMRMLEELIKEQLPDENTDSATGASR